jgi:hypothetical protein
MKISSHPMSMVVALLYLIGLSMILPLRYSASADNIILALATGVPVNIHPILS